MVIKYKSYVTPLLKNLQWLPISLRIKAKILTLYPLLAHLRPLFCFLFVVNRSGPHSGPQMFSTLSYPGVFTHSGLLGQLLTTLPLLPPLT